MLEWKASSTGRPALLIKGARRVGKSTLAKKFTLGYHDKYFIVWSL